jgi:SagB-type dehydrogenase family enzyme
VRVGDTRPLPPPDRKGRVPLETAIARRRSVREFADRPLSPEQIGQICWSAQGITDAKEGLRAAPSAGALYPVELYLVTKEGVDHYEPAGHRLRRHRSGDLRPPLRGAALDQEMIEEASACVAIAMVASRVSRRYGDRAETYCLFEVGHVAQNVLLQVEALGLAAVAVGAFDDRRAGRLLKLPRGQRVVYLIPVGFRRAG